MITSALAGKKHLKRLGLDGNRISDVGLEDLEMMLGSFGYPDGDALMGSMEENEDDKSLVSVASNQENIKPTATTSPNGLRQSTESIKRTPRKIFTALSQPSPQPNAPLSSRETMSSISMSVLNEAIYSPSKSKSSKSQSLKANLTTTLESVSASKQSINLALNNVRAAKKQAQERRRIATQRWKEEREQVRSGEERMPTTRSELRINNYALLALRTF